jgi:hypothetical protein
MNHSPTEKILERIDALIQKGENARSQRWIQGPSVGITVLGGRHRTSRGKYVPDVEPGPFHEWRTGALSLIESITRPDNVYSRSFQEHVNQVRVGDLECGIGILRALRADVENGYLLNYETLVVAELFVDFLDMAQYLLEHGYKDPAASLSGAVLGQGLRRICGTNDITVKTGDEISALNAKLADKDVYNRNMQAQIHAWKRIRNSAAHGRFEEYKAEEVDDMIKGVRRFLSAIGVRDTIPNTSDNAK